MLGLGLGLNKRNLFGGDAAPVASFTTNPSPATGAAPLTVAFTDTSANNPTSWIWTIVGGTLNVDYVFTVGSATSQNPTIRFDTAASYTVTLTATNGAGSDASDPATITAQFSTANLSGLQAWGRADTLVYDGSNLISQWTDKTGNGYSPLQATGANKPLRVASDAAINNRPTVEADGTNSFMFDTNLPSISQPVTIFFVAKRAAFDATSEYYICGSGASSPQVFSRAVNNGETGIIAGVPQFNSGVNGDANYHIVAIVFNGASSIIYIDGVAVAGTTGTGAMIDIYLFQNNAAGLRLGGRMAEWAITNVANTPAQIAEWTTAMQNYYGL